MPDEPCRPPDTVCTFDAGLSELERLIQVLDAFCLQSGIPDDPHFQINIAVEEVVINAIRHGCCQPPQAAIELRLRFADGWFEAEVLDTGIPFNPLDLPPPDLAAGVTKRKIGGLGVHLVRSLMSSVEYHRLQGRNCLRLRKLIEGEPHAD